MNRPVHFEIATKNPERMAEFYAELLGWEISTMPGGGGGYWLVQTGAEGTPGINGGIMGEELPQAVINTIEVASLEEMMEGVKAGGGKLLNEPNEIPEVGLHVYCTDPDGNLFGLLQPSEAS